MGYSMHNRLLMRFQLLLLYLWLYRCIRNSVVKALCKFVDTYNDMEDKLGKSDTRSVLRQGVWMRKCRGDRMNIQLQGGMNLGVGRNPLLAGNLMKSTQDRLERQNERDSQIAFFQNQKERLKEMECDDLEGIGRKLELLHSYEDQIAAAKAAYNQEQMRHVMDEAMERAEQIGEAAEKMEPKTPEERKKELAEEALGIDESKSELTENLEEVTEELTENLEEVTEELTENLEEVTEELTENPEELTEELMAKTTLTEAQAMAAKEAESAADAQPDRRFYERLDVYI